MEAGAAMSDPAQPEHCEKCHTATLHLAETNVEQLLNGIPKGLHQFMFLCRPCTVEIQEETYITYADHLAELQLILETISDPWKKGYSIGAADMLEACIDVVRDRFGSEGLEFKCSCHYTVNGQALIDELQNLQKRGTYE